jgi:hypothetical protein
MGRRGQASVLRRFNWDSEAEKLVQLYRALTVELQEHASTSPVPSTLRSSKLFFRRLSLKMAVLPGIFMSYALTWAICGLDGIKLLRN